MKKLSLLSLAALALAASSCSSDEPVVAPVGDEVEVTFTVSAPVAIGSRSISDGYSANDLYMSIYNGDTWVRDSVIVNAFDGTTHETTVRIKFVNGKTYKIAFWAQNAAAPYTFAKGKVTIDYSAAPVANSDIYDAFCNIDPTPFTVTSTLGMQTVELHRPFAQINFGASDWKDAREAGVEVVSSAMEFTADAYTGLDILDGSVSGKQLVTFTDAALPDNVNGAPSTLSVGGNDYDWVGMAYILVDGDAANVATVTHKYNNGEGAVAVNQVPVKRNYRTNIVGTLYTTEIPVYVIIKEEFEGEYNLSNDVTLLQNIAANGGNFTLNADIDLPSSLVIAAGKDVTIDLNGHNINMTKANTSAITAFGNLTINGEGNVYGGAGGDNVAVTARAGSNVTINGGTFSVGPDGNGLGNSTIYSNGGNVVINGGYFSSEAAYAGKYYVLNINNSSAGTITVLGGSFVNYNPASGDDKLGGNFVPAGYSVSSAVVGANTVYTVTKD